VLFNLNLGLVKEQKILINQVRCSLVASPVVPLLQAFGFRKLKTNEKPMEVKK